MVTRSEAIKNGYKIYNGKPCRNCGNTEKYVSNYSCVHCTTTEAANRTKEQKAAIDKRYKERHPEKIKTLKSASRARARMIRCGHEKQANVEWDKELTNFTVREMTRLKPIRKNETGADWEIDHIIPLRGKVVNGLHVWNNLQLIPMKENRLKANKFGGD